MTMSNILSDIRDLYSQLRIGEEVDAVALKRQVAAIERQVDALIEDNGTYRSAFEAMGISDVSARRIGFGFEHPGITRDESYRDQWNLTGEDIWIAVEGYNVHIDNTGSTIDVDIWRDDGGDSAPIASTFVDTVGEEEYEDAED